MIISISSLRVTPFTWPHCFHIVVWYITIIKISIIAAYKDYKKAFKLTEIFQNQYKMSNNWFTPLKFKCGDPLKDWMTLELTLWNSIFKTALFTALCVLLAGTIVFNLANVKWVCQCARWPIYQVNSLQVTITVKWEHVPINSTARSHIRSLSVPHPIESTFWCHTGFLFIQTLSHNLLYVLHGECDTKALLFV